MKKTPPKNKGVDGRGKKESEVTQLCPTLCNPMHCSLPGSSNHGILQASRLPLLFPGGLPYPETELRSPTLQAEALPSEPPGVAEDEGSYFDRETRESFFVVPVKVRLE